MAKFCRYCGSPIREGANFCPACGKSLAKVAAQQPPTKTKTTPSAPQKAQTTPSASQASWQEQYQKIHAQNRVQTGRHSASAAQPLGKTINSVGNLGNTSHALSNPGEIALELPGLSAATSDVKGGGLPGFVRFLLSIAAGGGSIPLLGRLGFPWSLLVGVGIAVLLNVLSSFIRKSKGGRK